MKIPANPKKLPLLIFDAGPPDSSLAIYYPDGTVDMWLGSDWMNVIPINSLKNSTKRLNKHDFIYFLGYL